MYEAFKITTCVLGVLSLYIGLVSLIESKGDLFFYVLPFNILFIWWYTKRQLRYGKKES